MSEGKTSYESLHQPGRQSYKLFMGGANAGDVLMRKSPIVDFPDEGMSQYSYEFFTDLNDIGDIGFARNIAAEHGFSIIEPDKLAGIRLGNMPHWRTYSRTSEGLYVSLKSGVLFEHHRDTPDKRDWTTVTQDAELALRLFDDIYEVPEHVKGREIFARYLKHWHASRDRILLDRQSQ